MKRREFLTASGVSTVALLAPSGLLAAPEKRVEPFQVNIRLVKLVERQDPITVGAVQRIEMPNGFGENMIPGLKPEPKLHGNGWMSRIRFDKSKMPPGVWGEHTLIIDQWSKPSSYHLRLNHVKFTKVGSLHVTNDFVVVENAHFEHTGWEHNQRGTGKIMRCHHLRPTQ